MDVIDIEAVVKRIDEMIELSKSYPDQSDWDKGYRKALNDLKREIQTDTPMSSTSLRQKG